MSKDLWSHSHDWDLGYAKGHKDGYEQGKADEKKHIVGILFGIDRQVAELVKEILNKEQK